MNLHHLKEAFSSTVVRTLTAGFLLVAVSSSLLGGMAAYLGLRFTRQQIENSCANSMTLLSDQIAASLQEAELRAGSVLLDDNLMNLSNADESDINLYQYAMFYKSFQLYSQSHLVTMNMTVVLPQQKWVISSQYGVDHLANYKGLANSILSPATSNIWMIRPQIRDGKTSCFSVVMGYVSREQSGPFIVIEVDEQALLYQMQKEFKGTRIHDVFLIDPVGQSYCYGPALSFSAETRHHLTTSVNRNNRWPIRTAIRSAGKNFQITFVPIADTGSAMGMAFDERELLQPISWITAWLGAGFLIALLAMLGFIMIAYRRIVTPSRYLGAAIDRVKSGNFHQHIPIERYQNTDFCKVMVQFNSMMDRINDLIRNEYQMQLQIKQAQLRFLQAQINPHFLYNSLFTLYNMIESGDLENAAELSIFLGKYYQQSSNLETRYIPLGREITNIQLFFRIQEMRFPDALHLAIDVPLSLQSFAIPVLSLQTVVENTITHGFQKNVQSGLLKIRAFQDNGVVVLEVQDNGVGIPSDRMEWLNRRLASPRDTDNGHGLGNVLQRMQIMYGDDVTMIISSGHPSGTLVRIRIPHSDMPNG